MPGLVSEATGQTRKIKSPACIAAGNLNPIPDQGGEANKESGQVSSEKERGTSGREREREMRSKTLDGPYTIGASRMLDTTRMQLTHHLTHASTLCSST